MSKENPAITQVLTKIADYIVNPAIGLMFALALIFFLYGVFEYFVKSNDPTARVTGSQHILWGLVGMVIMFGAYGIINIIKGTIGV
ncbi:MAG: hypothetical protein NUV47_00670 [Patescibacteria group bacterium]|nr:hypothetical protein [Patescibacteria group bacterium]